MRVTRRNLMALAFSVLALSHPAVKAQDFPARPVRLVLPYPAGGLSDVTTRTLAERLSKRWGQPVIVDNKPGATSQIGTQYAVRAEPDGYTLLVAERSANINPFIFANLPYQFARDLQPVAKLFTGSTVIAVPANSPFNSAQALLSAARDKPRTLNYATFGNGSFTHIDTEALLKKHGATAAHVPYKGYSEIFTALQAGDVDFALVSAGQSVPLVKAGRIKVLAYMDDVRHPDLPQVPSAKELNLVNSGSWSGLFAPAKTPAHIVEKISRDVQQVLEDPSLVASYSQLGLLVTYMAPQPFASFMNAEREYIGGIVKSLDLKPN